MLKTSLELLKKITTKGFEAYIVGGFPRDYYMKKKSLDVDICTNATPYELSKIFKGVILPPEKYGSLTIIYKNIRFEITTYRKELRYKNRKPIELEYINDLITDLKRRDFTINTLCIDSNGNLFDYLNGKKDIKNKVIKMIGDPELKLKEDILRLLRALRFATVLDFKLDSKLKKAIIKKRQLLKTLSGTRKKEELIRIFANPNNEYGIKLIKELGLAPYLGFTNFDSLVITDDILGIWAQLGVVLIYPFSKSEKEIIKGIMAVLKEDKIDNFTVYKYGLYITSIAGFIKGIDKKEINEIYQSLPIKSRNEIVLDVDKICSLVNKKPGPWIKNIYLDIETKILKGELSNLQEVLEDYIIKKIHTLE
ncbi:MAG: hypothetical protein ACOXZR_02485 [Bacilli bacterium]|jgi:tRNA nucleotidyltransferase (CCA-adding enzyme)